MTQAETKICQNCKAQFRIEPEDFLFYEKIQVPPPTFCPECRRQRRMMRRNDMNLYYRNCGLCEKQIVTIYAPDKPFPVYCQKCWWSDGWDPFIYGQEYDFSKPFFVQFKELQDRVPALALVNDNGIGSVNCEYTHDFAFSKNCYMVFIAWKIEDCMYDYYLVNGREIVDSAFSMGDCEAMYDTVYTEKSYRCRNIYYSNNLADCAFCYDCRDCSDCFMCVGLRHKKYYIKNKQHSKEEYERILAEYRLDTRSGTARAAKEFSPMLLQYPRRFSNMRNCVNCTGDSLINGKNAKNCFFVLRPEDCKWIEGSDTPKDSYDLLVGGELTQCYEGITPDHSHRSLFGVFSWKNMEVTYVDGCHASKYLFGCCGLRKGEYCILNKKYTKDEYDALVPKIKGHMKTMPYVDARGRRYEFGEFFPAELSYFSYNESVSQDYFPIGKEAAITAGLRWQEQFQITSGKETIKMSDLPDGIDDIEETITREVLACTSCGRNYRIVPQELVFYKKMRIPVPDLCFYCRHKNRMRIKNPHKLWQRKCGCAGAASGNGVYHNTAAHAHHGAEACSSEFETSYSPDRPEIVYCESCYQAEMA